MPVCLVDVKLNVFLNRETIYRGKLYNKLGTPQIQSFLYLISLAHSQGFYVTQNLDPATPISSKCRGSLNLAIISIDYHYQHYYIYLRSLVHTKTQRALVHLLLYKNDLPCLKTISRINLPTANNLY